MFFKTFGNDAGKADQSVNFGRRKIEPRPSIQNAESAKAYAVIADERGPGVKSYLLGPGNQRIALKPLVEGCIRNNQRPTGQDRMCTERNVPRRLRDTKAPLSVKPLLLITHERNEAERYIEQIGRKIDDPVKRIRGRAT